MKNTAIEVSNQRETWAANRTKNITGVTLVAQSHPPKVCILAKISVPVVQHVQQ